MNDLFGGRPEILRTIGFYQPFCSLMLHGKVETRWVRVGRFPAFPLGKYIGYCTHKFCNSQMLADWCGPELETLISETLKEDHTQFMQRKALWIGDLVKIGKMYDWQERECFVRHRGVIERTDKSGSIHDYYQSVLYFENIMPIEPFDFKYGKQGVGIFPETEKHLIKPIAVVIGARPSAGKSAFMGQLALNMARAKKKVPEFIERARGIVPDPPKANIIRPPAVYSNKSREDYINEILSK